MKKYIIIFSILFIMSFNFYSKDIQKLEVPKNVIVLGQSGTFNCLFVTVIDLSNNEIVILEYSVYYTISPGLVRIHRTGMLVNPEKQLPYIGTDSPGKDKDRD